MTTTTTAPGAAETVLPLSGLRADTLLAFLALLGLLRALEAVRPDWRPRVSWCGPPWLPRLHLDVAPDCGPDRGPDGAAERAAERAADRGASAVAAAAVAAAAAAAVADDGIALLAGGYAFDGHKNIDFTGKDFRKLAWAAATSAGANESALVRRAAADVVAALAADGCLNRAGDRVQATPLCAIFGQGHQNFLERLAAVVRVDDAADKRHRHLSEALFEPWTYAEEGLTFRWDPAEDRRYALGFADPGGEKIRTVPGANRLAAVGFPLFTCMPQGRHLAAPGIAQEGRELTVSWPVWKAPLGLAAVRTLLNHAGLPADPPDRAGLEPYGVTEVFRARRVPAGKYFSFSAAEALWGQCAC